CYSFQIEKDSEGKVGPEQADVDLINAYLANPASSNLPSLIFDVNRDQIVNQDDADVVEAMASNLNAPADIPWGYVLENESQDFSCFTNDDFGEEIKFWAYRMPDFDGSECN
ncbi:MAG: hypothetical protein HKN16_07775, partial [Saprospiraceae bacterium]|nr:hypothetical protein [Saprospiraceae bacterium]